MPISIYLCNPNITKKYVLLPANFFDKQNGRLHRANTFVHSLYILSVKITD